MHSQVGQNLFYGSERVQIHSRSWYQPKSQENEFGSE